MGSILKMTEYGSRELENVSIGFYPSEKQKEKQNSQHLYLQCSRRGWESKSIQFFKKTGNFLDL